MYKYTLITLLFISVVGASGCAHLGKGHHGPSKKVTQFVATPIKR